MSIQLIAKIKRLKKIKEERTSSKRINTYGEISFVEAVKKYGYTDRGDRLKFYPWLEEYAILISDLKINETLVTGCAQNSKTVLHMLLQIYLVVEKGYNVLWVFSQERVMQKMTAIQFKPMIERWLKASGRTTGKGKSTSTTLYQIGNANAIFSYASTSRQVEGKKGAAAGNAMVSFSADIAFMDEKSQYPASSDAPVYRRLDASRIDSHPIKHLGTPGASGTGISADMESCTHNFEPYCICEHCQEEIHLHPFGVLLNPEERTKLNGDKVISYLGGNGRPRNWFCHNENNAVVTAYFGCPHCKKEISDHVRVEKSYFRCTITGAKLVDFLEQNRNPKIKTKVGVHLFPTIKESEFNLASYIIDQGLSVSSPEDWCQQQLGLPSQTETVKITLEMIKRVMHSPLPDYRPPSANRYDQGSHQKVTLCGIDCGRSSHWMWIASYYIPHDRGELNNNQTSDRTIRVLEWCGDISKNGINDAIADYNIEFGIIDNEPDIESSSRLCDDTILEMADQRDGQLEEFKRAIALDGGAEYPVWRIRNEKFLRQVLNIFSSEDENGYPLLRMRCSNDWEKWFNLKSERSPIKHLTSVTYNPENRKFERPDDHIDDLYYAAAFCESAFWIWLEESRGGMWL